MEAGQRGNEALDISETRGACRVTGSDNDDDCDVGPGHQEKGKGTGLGQFPI